MLRNYILVALRNMRRFKGFTAINVFGLAIGLSICMVIIMSVAFQLTSDRFNSNAESIYRVTSTKINNTDLFGKNATTALPLATALNGHSGVEKAIRIRGGFGRHWVGMPDENHIPLSGLFADSGFISFFQYPMTEGDPLTALSNPYTVVLTKTAAQKLFGEENPMGKVIDMKDLGQYTVTGILDMQEIATHIEFEAIASMSSVESLEDKLVVGRSLDQWNNIWDGWVYFQMKENADPGSIATFIFNAGKENLPEDITYELGMQSILSIKPGELMGNEIGPFMPWIVVYVLSGLGIIIMISSCFNYINLSLARSMSRSREVGIRKVNGAGKTHVLIQFIVESVLMSLAALGLASLFLIYLEPAFEQLKFASIMHWDLSHEPLVWIFILIFTILTGAVAGLFPSLVMSSFQPLQVIKGIKNLKVFSHVGMRKLLIVVQFSLSLFFIISIMIFYNQVKMMMEADTGFQSENILTIPYDEDSYDVIRNEIAQQSWATSISRSSHLPATGTKHGADMGRTQEEATEGIAYYAVDRNYLENMGIPLISGRMLSDRRTGENESEVVLNEKAVTHLGFDSPVDALGDVIYTADSVILTIVGVVENYHHDALMLGIDPLVLRCMPQSFNLLQVKVEEERLDEARETLGTLWKSHRPDRLTNVKTIKESMTEFYELIFGDLISILFVFALIATFVSCLGLLGIAIYTTELRMKEVSIRKVMGAGNSSLIFILSWGFVKLVLIATAIAVPLAYLANSMWLNMMATRITMSPWFFISGTMLLLITALFTIGSQTIRSLHVNPADSLRGE